MRFTGGLCQYTLLIAHVFCLILLLRFFAHEHRYDAEVLDIKNGGLMVRPRPPPTKVETTPEPKVTSVHLLLIHNFQMAPTPITQPKEWDKSRLVVVDPFIREKVSVSGVRSVRLRESLIFPG